MLEPLVESNEIGNSLIPVVSKKMGRNGKQKWQPVKDFRRLNGAKNCRKPLSTKIYS
jgi:hypothetical protein